MKTCPFCFINKKTRNFSEVTVYKCGTKQWEIANKSYYETVELCYVLQQLDKGVSVESIKEIINNF